MINLMDIIVKKAIYNTVNFFFFIFIPYYVICKKAGEKENIVYIFKFVGCFFLLNTS